MPPKANYQIPRPCAKTPTRPQQFGCLGPGAAGVLGWVTGMSLNRTVIDRMNESTGRVCSGWSGAAQQPHWVPPPQPQPTPGGNVPGFWEGRGRPKAHNLAFLQMATGAARTLSW